MEKLEKIIKYLDGEVIGEEKQLLEKEIASSKDLTDTVYLIKEIDTIIQDTELVQFVNTMDEIQTNEKNRTSFFYINGNNRFIGKKFLLAASVILFIVILSVLYFISTPASNENLYSQFYNKYDACYVTRSGSSSTDELIVAIQLYDKKQYQDAISQFNEIIKKDNKNSAAHFFIGVSYMETKEFDKAIKSLNIVLAQKDTAFLEHAEWYLALCYLKTNQIQQAKNIIDQIKSSDSYYRGFATDLSNKIK